MGYEDTRIVTPLPGVKDGFAPSRNRQLLVVAALAAIAYALSHLDLGAIDVPMHEFIPLHTVLEMVTIMLAILACVTIVGTPVEHEIGPTLVLAAALCLAAALNFAHLMTIPTMPELISPAVVERSLAFSLASRSLICGALLALSIEGRFSESSKSQVAAQMGIYTVATGLAIVLVVQGYPIPLPIDTGVWKIEWLFAGVLTIAAVRFYIKAKTAETQFYPLVFSAAAASAIGQFMFAGDEAQTSLKNLTRHIYSVIAYWWLYRAVFEVWVRRPFKRLSEQAHALQKSNDTLRLQSLALESAPTSITLTDSAGRVVWQNKASYAYHPYRPGATPDTPFIDLLQGHDSETVKSIQNSLDTTGAWKALLQATSASGELRYFDNSITAVRGGDGSLTGYVALADDVTDTIKGQMRYKRVLETAQDGFVITDYVGNYLEVNDAFIAMVGYSRQELLSMNGQALLVEGTVAEWVGGLVTGNADQNRFSTDLRCKDGSTIRAQCSVAYVADEKRFYGFIHDSTAEERAHETQRALEAQLLHAQKVHALGALTSGIAHDFNNILASVLGYSNLALDRFVPEKESRLAQYLREVISASERARDLISKMLTFTRAKPDKTLTNIPPEAAIQEVVAMMRPSIPSNIGMQIRRGPPVTVLVDSGELHQMLVNLIINSRDAILSHGEITIGWEVIETSGRTCAFSRQPLTGNFVSIFVSDSGTGIDSETLEHIFDPYFTTKDVGKGSGLGLPMVQGIMYRAGGHVLVESAPGRGTTFRLLFPITSNNPAADSTRTPDSARPPAGKGQRIWVVDDDEAVARYVRELLETWGYACYVFHEPQIAWAAFSHDPNCVDLVVTDHTMHGMTGTELVEKLLSLKPNLPVIICSGRVDEVDLDEESNIPVFRKPVDTNEFLLTVAILLAQVEK